MTRTSLPRANAFRVCSGILLLFACAGCVPELTRAEAERLAQKHIAHGQWTMTVYEGLVTCYHGCETCCGSVQCPVLEDLGWIETECSEGKQQRVTLTERGRKELKVPEPAPGAPAAPAQVRNVPFTFADWSLTGIVDIAQQGETARVTYARRFGPTPLGERVLDAVAKHLNSPRSDLCWKSTWRRISQQHPNELYCKKPTEMEPAVSFLVYYHEQPEPKWVLPNASSGTGMLGPR